MTSKQSGFTLIEVLISMLLLALGLLGLAALQATSLRNNQSGYFRSQATQLAYDMADRIRANPVEGLNRANASPSTLSQTVYAQAVTNNFPATQSTCGSSPGCTPALLAQDDRAVWRNNLQILPSGTGSVAVDATTRIVTITVSWDDNKSGSANTSFLMSFQL